MVGVRSFLRKYFSFYSYPWLFVGLWRGGDLDDVGWMDLGKSEVFSHLLTCIILMLASTVVRFSCVAAHMLMAGQL